MDNQIRKIYITEEMVQGVCDKHVGEAGLNSITEIINVELLKRGYPSITLSLDYRHRWVAIKSEQFNTTPVIFKNITVNNFGGSIKLFEFDRELDDDQTECIDYIKLWIPVHVSYEHFEGGSNGTKLFNISFDMFNGSIQEWRLK